MKLIKNFLILCVSICMFGCSKSNIIEIPVTIKQGYGPFEGQGLGGISPDMEHGPWSEIYLQVTGIPAEWTDAKKGDINLNFYQTVYQNYLQGNISQEYYDLLQKSWGSELDTLKLSKQPLKCSIAFAFGKDSTGETKMVVDANNNLDFSDDIIFTPVSDPFSDSVALARSIEVTYERLSNDKIVEEKVPLFIIHLPSYNMYMSNVQQYDVATFEGKELAIRPNQFHNLTYSKTHLILMNENLKNGQKASKDSLVSENEYLSINGKLYQYKGVNRNKNVAILEKVDLPKDKLHSTQSGFKAIPFEGLDFNTKKTVSLDSYKGKYLYLDFWSVGCGPCIKELPNLKTLYESLDKSKVEILGIVGDSPAEILEKVIEKFNVTWPQILSDEIKNRYEIYGYPSTFLIDPEGVITAKNLRGEDLEKKIRELLAK